MIDENFKEGDKHAAIARNLYAQKSGNFADEVKKALNEYGKAHERDPTNPEYYRKVGELFLGTGRPQEALEQFNRAVEMKPEAANYRVAKGKALNVLGRYEEALAELDAALSVNPKNSSAFLEKSMALKNIGRLDEALSSINSAIEFLPRYTGMEGFLAYYYEIKAGILMALGSSNEALSVLDEAERISPVNRKGYSTRRIMRANLLNLTGRYREALDEFTSLLAINPSDAFFHYGKAVALEKLGDHKTAMVEIENALQLDPTNELFRKARERMRSEASP
ncbi:MAG: tetratricopeptide repeat protein [Conexivisphaera sp.]